MTRWRLFLKEEQLHLLPGTRDMWCAYSDMREANWKDTDKYFLLEGTMMLPKGTRRSLGC
ncbi:hypothetical protein U0070_012767 [Myodes glareolus]|uniref:Serum amyloid A protein n=1 Tax=Myodes glareolus TaxID=447135 RepID=A0AAW0HDI1_MYOGA